MKVLFSIFSLTIVLLSFSFTQTTHAQPIPSRSVIPDFNLAVPLPEVRGLTQDQFNRGEGLGVYIVGVYKFAITFASIAAMLVLIYGGVLWLTARGDSGRVGESKKVMTNAIIGLILALGSYTFLWIFNPRLVSFKPLKIDKTQELSIKFDEFVEEYKEPSLEPIRSHMTRNKNAYDPLFKKYGQASGIDCTLLKALSYQESGLNANIGTNHAGATGLMQVIGGKWGRPSNAALNDPETNVKAGVGILLGALKNPCPRSCRKPYRGTACADCKAPNMADLQSPMNPDGSFKPSIEYALAAYNAGACGANVQSRMCAGQCRWKCDGEIKHNETLKYAPGIFGHYKKMKEKNWGC